MAHGGRLVGGRNGGAKARQVVGRGPRDPLLTKESLCHLTRPRVTPRNIEDTYMICRDQVRATRQHGVLCTKEQMFVICTGVATGSRVDMQEDASDSGGPYACQKPRGWHDADRNAETISSCWRLGQALCSSAPGSLPGSLTYPWQRLRLMSDVGHG